MNPKVIILVLNWNRKDLTMACVESLNALHYDNYEIVVLDNFSEDGSEQAIREKFPSVTVIQNGANLGYAEGNNRGMRWALAHGADYIFILNNDTEADRECLANLVQVAESDSGIGILGPRPFSYSEKEKALKYTYALNEENLVANCTPKKEDESARDRGSYQLVDWIQGDAFFVRRKVLETIGFFDPKYFFGFEEIDFCCTARKAGFKLGVVKLAKFWRMDGGTMARESPLRARYVARNELLLIWKHAKGMKRLSATFYFLKRKKWEIEDECLPLENITAIFRGVLDFVLGRFGKINA